ncbi:DUF4160 domain-containing protein [Nostoc sp. FACHB-892]|uniref:DUF4160 domain-containing protein n=1 Tax=Nostoc sp. FACHB-892 TaxID=2692843 RepID=UPI001689D624|nr:DUF4160 domain-containing protein [Nostoc sp. FACHB-892]
MYKYVDALAKLQDWRSPPPHFHAIYGEYNALISIESLETIEGDLPNRAQKLVQEWATLYQQELLQMWNTQEFRKLPPLK